MVELGSPSGSLDGEVTVVPYYTAKSREHSPRGLSRGSFKNMQNFATVVVGNEESRSRPQTRFTVHKELLTTASPFFHAALNGTFAEGLDQIVSLPEEKPEIFEWFLWWLYTGSLSTPGAELCSTGAASPAAMLALFPPPGCGAASAHHTHPHTPPASTHADGDLRNSAGSPKYFLLLDLYSLSDKLLTTPLSNHIVDTIARLSEATNSVPTPSDTWILYDGIRDTAPARRLVLDLFAYKKTDKLLESHRDEWHPRFLRELCVRLKRPGAESVERHALQAWRPASWPVTKACEACRELLKPGVGGERCQVCDRAFCGSCVRVGRVGSILGGEVGACKPWLRGACARYHEHEGRMEM